MLFCFHLPFDLSTAAQGPGGGSQRDREPSPSVEGRALQTQIAASHGAALKGAVVEMFRMKIMLAGLLAMLALGSVASATASAELNGPWWRHPEGGKQVLYPEDKPQEIISENQSPFQLKSRIAGLVANIQCNKVTNKGFIWNSLHQGADKALVEFTECEMKSPCVTKEVKVEPVEVYTELMWKYGGKSTELKEAGQQKIYDAFAPIAEPKEVEPKGKGEFRSLFTNIKVGNTGCLGVYPVEAAGTKTTFRDQNQETHPIIWGTAAEVAPQNKDAKQGELIWKDPNVTILHHQEVPIEAKLLLGKEPAGLQGQIKVERTNGEEFGAFNE
jgi:hypothetical protein